MLKTLSIHIMEGKIRNTEYAIYIKIFRSRKKELSLVNKNSIAVSKCGGTKKAFI